MVRHAQRCSALASVVNDTDLAAFPVSRTLKAKVVKNEGSIVEWEQEQAYTLAFLRYTVTMPSLVHIELDEEEKIAVLEDRWCAVNAPLSLWLRPRRYGYTGPSFTPLWLLRRLNARTMPYVIGVPKRDE